MDIFVESVSSFTPQIKKYILLVYLGFLLLCFCFYLFSCIFISSFRINWYNYGICEGETGW